jgi:hypothetical protein
MMLYAVLGNFDISYWGLIIIISVVYTTIAIVACIYIHLFCSVFFLMKNYHDYEFKRNRLTLWSQIIMVLIFITQTVLLQITYWPFKDGKV